MTNPLNINAVAKNTETLLAEARQLLDQVPLAGERLDDVTSRYVAAVWRIAEVAFRVTGADYTRVQAAIGPGPSPEHWAVLKAAIAWCDHIATQDNPFLDDEDRALIDAVNAYVASRKPTRQNVAESDV